MIFNTAVAVVAMIEAETKEAAIQKLNAALRAAGFEPIEIDPVGGLPDAFKSEPE